MIRSVWGVGAMSVGVLIAVGAWEALGERLAPSNQAWVTYALVGVGVAGVSLLSGAAAPSGRALAGVRGALASVRKGRMAREDLLLDADLGPEASAWNAMVDELDALRNRRLDERVERTVSGGGGSVDGLALVCDSLWQGLILVTEQSRITYANGAAGVLLQARREELVGASVANVIQSEEAVRAISEVADGRSRRRVSVEVDLAPGEGDGESMGVLRLTVRPTPQSHNSAALIVIEDVTQQRVADRSRTAFVANATHELRTPLTNIRLYVEEAQDANGNEEIMARAMNVINTEARRLERIVSDMLSASEIEAGSLSLRESDVRTDALFEELQQDYKAQAVEKGVELKFDLPPKLPVLTGDRDKIAMALHNLLGNAIKYTPAGGSVTVRAEEGEGVFRVDVQDTGIGISEEDRARVFEKFYRAKDGRIKGITGSGIGLATARDVVRLHGGDIDVESEVDEGSTFTMTLPMRSAAA